MSVETIEMSVKADDAYNPIMFRNRVEKRVYFGRMVTLMVSYSNFSGHFAQYCR